MRETGERMKGGAVRDERSPEKEAMLREGMRREMMVMGWMTYDLRNEDHEPRCAAGTACRVL